MENLFLTADFRSVRTVNGGEQQFPSTAATRSWLCRFVALEVGGYVLFVWCIYRRVCSIWNVPVIDPVTLQMTLHFSENVKFISGDHFALVGFSCWKSTSNPARTGRTPICDLFSDPTASNNIVKHRADQEPSTMLSHRQPSIKLPSPAKASTMAWCIW
jgi:hypothetical protein